MSNPKLQFVVTVPQVPGVPASRWKEYIKDAVQSWAGQFEPVDGGYDEDKAGSGDPLGPPCGWSERVDVRRLR